MKLGVAFLTALRAVPVLKEVAVEPAEEGWIALSLTLVKHKKGTCSYAALKYYVSERSSNRFNGRVGECVRQMQI